MSLLFTIERWACITRITPQAFPGCLDDSGEKDGSTTTTGRSKLQIRLVWFRH